MGKGVDIGTVIALHKALGGGGGGSSGGGVLVVHEANATLDRTWQEIHDAMLIGGVVIEVDGGLYALKSVEQGMAYFVETSRSSYIATSASDYPVLEGDD